MSNIIIRDGAIKVGDIRKQLATQSTPEYPIFLISLSIKGPAALSLVDVEDHTYLSDGPIIFSKGYQTVELTNGVEVNDWITYGVRSFFTGGFFSVGIISGGEFTLLEKKRKLPERDIYSKQYF